MSLEQMLEKHGEKIDRLTAAIEKAGGLTGSTSVEEKAKPGRPKGKVPDISSVKAVADKLRALTSKATTVALLKKIGNVGSTTELDAKHYAAFIAAGTAAIAAAEGPEDDDEDDDDEDDDDC